jgi:hypothetical protein
VSSLVLPLYFSVGGFIFWIGILVCWIFILAQQLQVPTH